MDQWQPNINWNLVNQQTGGLILAQGDAYLKETVETAKAITAKAEKLITIIIPIFTGLSVFVCNSFQNFKWSFLNISALVAIVPAFIALIYIAQNFFNYNIGVSGVYPKVLLANDLINDQTEEKHIYNTVLFHVLATIQSRIEKNNKCNHTRSELNNRALITLIVIPFSPVVSWVLMTVLNCHSGSPL